MKLKFDRLMLTVYFKKKKNHCLRLGSAVFLDHDVYATLSCTELNIDSRNYTLCWAASVTLTLSIHVPFF